MMLRPNGSVPIPRHCFRAARTLTAVGCAVFCALASVAHGQRLAQPRWANSGMTPQTWWSHAVFCAVDLGGSQVQTGDRSALKGVTGRLDALSAAGCDALLLRMLSPEDSSASPAPLAYGTLDDADELIVALGRRRMRLLLNLPLAAPKADPEARARLWLTRGVAGFFLEGSPPAGLLQRLHTLIAVSPGTRLLIAGPGFANSATAVQLVQLPLSGDAKAASLRATLTHPGLPGDARPLLSPSESALSVAGKQPRLAIPLLQVGPVELSAAELGIGAVAQPEPREAEPAYSPDDLLLWQPKVPATKDDPVPDGAWLHALIALRQDHPALQDGHTIFLDEDARNLLVWVVQPRGVGATLVVACNLSGHPVTLALRDPLRAQTVHGTYLRTLLRSEANPMQPATIDHLDLPISGVFVGEMR